ncbi:Yip1-domain-containing protein [Polychaeton citri CBS 116435]|uniref:Yip1-domain-containing protein n=1 Tax=Polychaeton citri CBS 116435 TaxID=1314669 RepID=A0A9P4UL64_9PEZI|nr:Yip1-domain-containing protein [Polychaeton citri CBS 116435]
MASYGYQPQQQQQSPSYAAQNNLNFYQSSYATQSVSGHSTPFQAAYGSGAQSSAYPAGSYGAGSNYGFGAFPGQAGVSGQMGTGASGLSTGWLAAFGTEGYEGEPPLLEELGVNFGHIKMKTFTVLNPLARIDQHIMDDADLAGPILYCILFGTFLILSGKLWLGYVAGLAAIGSFSLHTIFSMMSPPLTQEEVSAAQNHSSQYHASSHLSSSLTYGRSSSVLGYCLLPLVFASLLGVVLPLDSVFGYVVVSAAIAWCTYSSSGMFCVVGRMIGMRGLVAYPLALFYVGFGIMAIFSSRGTGRMDNMKVDT